MSDGAYWWERGESLAALRESEARGDGAECADHEHAWRANSRGGGTCVQCGDEVGRDEL